MPKPNDQPTRDRPDMPYCSFTELLSDEFDVDSTYEVWRKDGTPDWLLTCTLDGAGRIGHAAGDLICRPRTLALVRPGHRHDYGTNPAAGHWHFLWAHFHPRPTWHELLAWPAASAGVLHLDLSESPAWERVETRLRAMHYLATGAEKRGDFLAMNALEEALLWCDAEIAGNGPRLDGRVRRAIEIMCRRLRENHPLETLAEACGLSASRLSHLFQEQVGRTPQQFLELQRLQRAKQLLERTDRSIHEIAYDLGYQNPFYFTRRFKRHAGKSPRAYRDGKRSV